MNIAEIRKTSSSLHKFISAGRLNHAIVSLHEAARETICPQISERLEDITFTYNTMLDYYIGGADDPQRDLVRRSVVEKAHELVDDWADEAIGKQGSTQMKATIMATNKPTDIIALIDRYRELNNELSLTQIIASDAEQPVALISLIEEIFGIVWALKPTAETCKAIEDFINDDSLPEYHRELLVGAIVLGLAHRFVPIYAQTLLNLCTSSVPRIAARSMVGVFFSLLVHPTRWENHNELLTHLEAIAEQQGMRRLLFEVFIVIERSRVAKTIEDKVKNEITPELLKMRNIMGSKFGFDMSAPKGDIMADTDWDELFRKSPKLKSSIDQLSRWQMEGVDISLSTFRHMKDFAFFSHLCNWLLPFYKQQPMLAEAIKNEPESLRTGLASKIASTFSMCDSDKYSILLSFSVVPIANKQAMSAMYKTELDQSEEMFNEGAAMDASKKHIAMANQFVQDLYRLFNLHPRRREFQNIFTAVPDFHNTNIFADLFPDENYIEMLGEFYVRHELYADAGQTYDKLLQTQNDNNLDTMRKAAYCRMMSGQTETALDMFLKVDLADDSNLWTKKKIAQCYYKLKKYNSAMFYLQQVEKADPDNKNVKASIGDCQMQLGNTSEALKCFFEVEYEQPTNIQAIRAIAWCSFVERKLEQASTYIDKIRRDEFSAADFMLLGHIRLCQGHRREAISAYRSSVTKYPTYDQFTLAFLAEAKYLQRNGIAATDVPFVVDAVLRGA